MVIVRSFKLLWLLLRELCCVRFDDDFDRNLMRREWGKSVVAHVEAHVKLSSETSAKMLVIIEKSALILGSLLNRSIISITYTNYRFIFKRGFLHDKSFHLFPGMKFPLHPILSQIHSSS